MTAPRFDVGNARMSRIERCRTVALRLLLAVAGWWIVNEGRAMSVSFSAIVILIAVLVGMRVSDVRPARWRLRGLVELAGVFLIGSLRGGIDVARRAFARSVPVDPAMVEYQLQLLAGPGARVFTGALSMAPGSLVVEERGACLGIHVLVQDDTTQQLAARLERSIDHAVGEERKHA
jgi:multicomponent Na+:H+ antiporter subunit E